MNKRLYLAKQRGFCAGVERAIAIVEKAIEMYGAPIWVKHHIVHNIHVIKELESKGAIFIENLDDVPIGERVVYSAHGVSPKVREEAKARSLVEIDATCCLVTRLHSATKLYASKGYHIILIGHKNHVEIIGVAGEALDATTIVENLQDVDKLNFNQEDKLFYLIQTTLGLDDAENIKNAIKTKFPKIKTLPTSSICYATTSRQLALKKIIENNVEIIFIIGDPASSNSNRLREVGESKNINSYLVNSPQEIDESWLNGVKRIGMSAGASTPEYVVQQCVDRLYLFGVNKTICL